MRKRCVYFTLESGWNLIGLFMCFHLIYQIINEVLLGQGKVIEALRLANKLAGADSLSARKYLEAAKKTNNPIIFYTVYTWFQQRNIRQRGSPDFLKSMCKIY